MKEGQQILFWRDDQPPLKSDLTHLVAAALICGFEFANDKPLLDTLEEVDGEPRRSVTWSFDGASKAVFPPFKEGAVDLTEFRKCFESLDWCQANPDHPIAYLRAFSDALSSLRNELRTRKPLLLIRRGRRFALIPQDADPARKAQLLAML